MFRRLRSLPQEAFVLAALLIGLPCAVYAASNYPVPAFSQVGAGETSGGASLLPQKMDPDADGVTGHAVVDSTVLGSSGATYSVTYPDQEAVTANITTASTTLVVAGVAGECIYAFYLGVWSTSTNSGDTYGFAYGPNSSTLTYIGASFASGSPVNTIPTSANIFNPAYANSTTLGTLVVAPAALPRIIPAAQNLYIVTTGTTIAVKGYALYAQH